MKMASLADYQVYKDTHFKRIIDALAPVPGIPGRNFVPRRPLAKRPHRPAIAGAHDRIVRLARGPAWFALLCHRCHRVRSAP